MKLYIQTNKRQEVAAKISASSFIKNGFNKENIFFMRLEDNKYLKNKFGKKYLRNGKLTTFKNDLQSFTLLRFFAPQMNNFSEKILIIDPDVFAIKNIDNLNNILSDEDDMCCTFIDGLARSEVMFVNAKKIRWNFEKIINDLFNLKIDYKDLINLKFENQKKIKKIDKNIFNCHDDFFDNTIFLHTSNRSTQPWKEGLQLEYDKYSFFAKLKILIKKTFRKSNHNNIFHYTRHPNLKVIKIIKDFYIYGLKNNIISKNEVDNSIKKKYLSKIFINN